jgi:hypothetical protein
MAAEAQEKKEKKEKKKPSVPTETADEAPKASKAPATPRAPVDPRLKVLRKFQGKLLPKGALRDRFNALMVRWNSAGGDHGGVTVMELQSLLDEWKATRA